MAVNADLHHADIRPWTASHFRRTPPSRPTLLLACILALATALTLLGASLAFIDRSAPPPPVDEDVVDTGAVIAVAHHFYAAVNDVLRTGDPAPLATIIAPDLVEHHGRADASGAEGLVRTLLAERATWPGMRLLVDEIRATGPDEVAVWVHAVASPGVSVLGFTVTALLESWGPMELLRIADERIAERWANGGESLLIEPLGQLPPVDTEDQTVMTVERRTYSLGAADELVGGIAPRLLYVEAGTVQVTGSQPSGTNPSSLAAGGVLVIEGDTTVTNAGPEPAMVVIATTIRPPSDGGLYFLESPPQAITSEVSTIELTVLDTTAAVPATFGRITLEPGATLTRDVDAGPTVILVERGTSWVAPIDGRVRVITSDGGLHQRNPAQSIVPGEMVLLPVGTLGTWQAGEAEPVSLLVVTTGPIASTASTDATGSTESTESTGSTAILALTTGQVAPDATSAPSPPATPLNCVADRQPDPTCR